ncbi:MAG: PAS domain S-box protein [bacterium]|nr:PAS domain S-box protein [bacterium]
MSIRLKLIITFLAVASIPLLIISILTFNNYRNSLEANRLIQLENTVAFKTERIETYFGRLKSEMEITQGLYNIRKNLTLLSRFLNDPSNPESISAKKTLDEQLRRMQSILHLFDIMLIDNKGIIVYTSSIPHYSREISKSFFSYHEKAFSEGKNKIYFSEIFLNKTEGDKPAVLITAPASDLNGAFAGVIAFEVDLAPMYEIISDVTGLGNTGETLLGRAINNQVVYLNPLRHDPQAVLKRQVEIGKSLGGPIQEAVKGKFGSGQLIDYRGKNVIAAWRHIPSLDWGIVSKIDSDEAFADAINLRNITILILTIILILSCIMAFSIANSISEPIKKLSNGAEIIGSGNLNHKVEINSRDEIGQLSRSFDKMTGKLKLAQEHLFANSQYARNLIEASLDPLVTISTDGKITDVNEATIRATGKSREKLIGTDFSGYFTEPEKARAGYLQVFSKGFVTDYPLTIRHKDGKLTDVLYNASVYKDTHGNVTGVFAAARDVTESKRIMSEFVKTKNFLDNILQSSIKYSIIGKDINQRILSWNEGAYRNYGYKAEEIIGKNSNILHVPEDIRSGAVEKLLTEAYEKGIAEGEFQRVRKDGSNFTANLVVTRRDDTSGKPIGYLVISSDISEKKRAEEKSKQASQYARSLIEASLDPLVTISADGKITDVNEATIRATGKAREELIGTDFSGYFTEPEKARAGYLQVFSKGFVTDYPLTIRRKDGKLTDVLYNASVYKDTSGNITGIFAAARDVTLLKQASQYARSLIEASLDPLVTISADGKITDVNEATIRATEKTREELIGTDFSGYFTEPEKARAGYLQVFAKGFVTDYPLTIRRKDGKLIDVLYNASVYKDNSGNVSGVFAAARDVTDIKKAREVLEKINETLEQRVKERSLELFESEKRLNRAQEISHLGGWELNLINNRLSWSDEVYRIFGFEPQEFTATYEAFLDAIHPDDRAAVDSAYSGSVREGSDKYEIEHRIVKRSTGEIRFVHEKCEHIRDASGKIIRSVGMVHDITERKKAEDNLKRANENLEQFAYVASHDLQEPLRTMSSFSQLLAHRYKARLDPDADDFIDFITDAANRMQKLIIDLLAYSRIGRVETQKTDVDCNSVLGKVVTILSSVIEGTGAVITHDTLPVSVCNESNFLQLFQNLISNAIKFRGKEAPHIHISAKKNGNEWLFSVSDNGIGIDEKYKEKIFLIFQRLHGRDKYPGTGIGLSICKKIIETHGGRIWVESQVGKGSTFYFTIPANIQKEAANEERKSC